MPDIQMCTGVYTDSDTGEKSGCGVRHVCYRHVAKPSMHQSWGNPAGDFQLFDGCDNYIPTGDRRL